MASKLIEVASVHAATLHDALSKAKQIAPTKGAAFDRAQGFHLTFGQSGLKPDWLEVRSSDLDMTYWQRIEADVLVPCVIRLPSIMLAGFVGGLSMGSEADRVVFLHDEDDPRAMVVRYKNTKLKLRCRAIQGDSFPTFGPVDISSMLSAQDLATRLEMVAWAVDDGGKLAGVHINGEHLIAMTTKYAACVQCPIDADAPVTALMKNLTGLMKVGTDIKIKAEERRLVIALDEASQLTTAVIREEYPVGGIAKIRELTKAYEAAFTIKRQRLIDGMNRLLVVVRNDRLPRANLTINNGNVLLSLRADAGEIEDAAVITDQTGWAEPVNFILQPNWCIQALSSFTTQDIRIAYGPDVTKPLYITDPSNEYEVWMMPMGDASGTV